MRNLSRFDKGLKKDNKSLIIRVLLVTNYRLDFQYSMLRFANHLLTHTDYNRIEYSEIAPKPVLNRIPSYHKFKKWNGYIDKYILFPKFLRKELERIPFNCIHIVDHSNAVYIPKKQLCPTLLTCHDLIAVQMAKENFPEAPKTSASGKRLQNWISQSLTRADFFACDSSSTEKILHGLIPTAKNRSEVIHLGVRPREHIVNSNHGLPFNLKNTDFLLHVGSSAWYKNRKRLLKAFVDVKEGGKFNNLKLVLVGPVPQPEELTEKTERWLNDNSNELLVLSDLSESGLQSLYEHANALIFPSLIEGFGWPPLEARSLGCAVIASKTGAMDDILGSAARYVDPKSTKDIVVKIKEILDADRTNGLPPHIPKARECAKAYENLYQRMVESK